MEFGRRLLALRRRKGLTLERIAKQTGMSKGYLSGIQNGKVRPPTDRHIRKLARVLGQDEIEMLKLAHYDKLPKELQDICRDVLLPKTPPP